MSKQVVLPFIPAACVLALARICPPAAPPSHRDFPKVIPVTQHLQSNSNDDRGRNVSSVVLGTRGSALALHQAHYVAERLAEAHPDLEVDIRIVSSEGDVDKTSPLTRIGGRGVFTSSLQHALATGGIDLAVHSSKDVPGISAAGLVLAAFPQREDPRDVVVSRHGVGLAELPPNPVVGTSSRRRAAQVLALRPDATIVDLRGNIDTRLRKAESEPYDAVILAAAGISRMGWLDRATEMLPIDRFTPAPGQGALAIETRVSPDAAWRLAAALDDPAIHQALDIERAFLRGVGGGCTTPLAAHARVETVHGRQIVRFWAMLARDDGTGLERVYDEWPAELAVDAAFETATRLVAAVRPNRVFGGAADRSRQLTGVRAIVTGTDDLVDAVRAEVARRGGDPVVAPTIRIAPPQDTRPLADAADALVRGEVDWVALTSREGVKAMTPALQQAAIGTRFGVVGEGTAGALRDIGVSPDVVATDRRAEGLVDALRPLVRPGERVLLPVSDRARPVVEHGLHAAGAVVTRIDAYTTETIDVPDPTMIEHVTSGGISAVLLASPSAAEGLVVQLGTLLPAMSGAAFVAIGPVTAEAMRHRGLPVHAVASPSDAIGLVDALARYLWGQDVDLTEGSDV